MISKIASKLNDFAWQKGYNKAISDHKKEIARIYRSQEELIKNLKYDHETELMSERQECNILQKKLAECEGVVKKAEQDRLICKRERAFIKKCSKWVKEEISTLHMQMVGPLKTMLAVADEMDKETKDTKRIER